MARRIFGKEIAEKLNDIYVRIEDQGKANFPPEKCTLMVIYSGNLLNLVAHKISRIFSYPNRRGVRLLHKKLKHNEPNPKTFLQNPLQKDQILQISIKYLTFAGIGGNK